MCTSDHDDHNESPDAPSRRQFLRSASIGAAAVGVASLGIQARAEAATDPYAPPDKPALPPSNMVLDLPRTALVITDPQIDFLSPDGVTWGVVGKSVTAHNTVANIGRLLTAAKSVDMVVAVSPHYYYPTDKGWRFEGALEKLMHKISMFDRPSPYSMAGFDNSGADFMPEYKELILDGKTIVTDLVLQLRKNKVDQVILGGMSANLCVEAHMRELLEQGFEVAVVKDATAAAMLPEGDGYLAAIINFRYMANALWSTDEAVKRITAT